MSDLLDRMRQDWDWRARNDAKYYITCQRRNQDDAEFDQGADDVIARIRRDYAHLPVSRPEDRVFLEIGCGIGRLMRVLAEDCGLIHGVDISPEMVRVGRERLSQMPGARFHVASNNDLSEIPDRSIDFVYSHAVFQHLPDREFVHRYMDEAWRVLKPGGVFCGQFNGAPAAVDPDTWVGVWISERDLLTRCTQNDWRVLSSECPDSQYMWLTMRKALPEGPLDIDDAWRARILAVARPEGSSPIVAGGPLGFASIYISGIPEHLADLMSLSVTMGERPCPIRYIGPLLSNGVRQINVQVPDDTPTGKQPVVFQWRSEPISEAFDVQLQRAEPRHPRLVAVTDADETFLGNVIRCGKIIISVDGCQDIATLSTAVDGRQLVPFCVFCVDPLAALFQAKYDLPSDLGGDEVVITVEVDGEQLLPRVVRLLPYVVGSSITRQ